MWAGGCRSWGLGCVAGGCGGIRNLRTQSVLPALGNEKGFLQVKCMYCLVLPLSGARSASPGIRHSLRG